MLSPEVMLTALHLVPLCLETRLVLPTQSSVHARPTAFSTSVARLVIPPRLVVGRGPSSLA